MIKKIGWDSLTIIILFIIVFSFAFIKRCNLKKRAVYTKGISRGISVGVHGNHSLDYTFDVGGDELKGFVPSSFCDKCNGKCCVSGDTVIVRYEDGNPGNNDLVVQLPKGASLQ